MNCIVFPPGKHIMSCQMMGPNAWRRSFSDKVSLGKFMHRGQVSLSCFQVCSFVLAAFSLFVALASLSLLSWRVSLVLALLLQA